MIPLARDTAKINKMKELRQRIPIGLRALLLRKLAS